MVRRKPETTRGLARVSTSAAESIGVEKMAHKRNRRTVVFLGGAFTIPTRCATTGGLSDKVPAC